MLAFSVVFTSTVMHSIVDVAAWIYVGMHTIVSIWVSAILLNIHFNKNHNTEQAIIDAFRQANNVLTYTLDILAVGFMSLLLFIGNFIIQAELYLLFSTALILFRMLCKV